MHAFSLLQEKVIICIISNQGGAKEKNKIA